MTATPTAPADPRRHPSATPRPPVLFVSHGSPMFALEPGRLGPQLERLGRELAEPAAILVVSPHWQTRALAVGAASAPATMHDFGGFPAPLYALQYRAPGAPALASAIAAGLAAAGYAVQLDTGRGLDHGAWVPLRYLRPAADVPVLQVSMPHDLDAAGALQLGRALAPWREQGVLIVGSGSLTHNLGEFRRPVADPDYARTFADWIADAVGRGDIDALRDYRRRAPHAARAHPTEEHFLPLLVALGAADAAERGKRLEGGMTDRILSMDSFLWGHPATTA